MMTVSLKRWSKLDPGPEAETLRALCCAPASAPLAPLAPLELRPVGRFRSRTVRESIVRELASAVAFCNAAFVPVAVHADFVRVSPRGRVTLFVGSPEPDSRYLAPEGACASWAIGALLYLLVTGSPLLALSALATEMRRIRCLVRCVGTPDWRECAALGIKFPAVCVSRAHVRGASRAERAVLTATLAWVAADRMVATARGLRALPTIRE